MDLKGTPIELEPNEALLNFKPISPNLMIPDENMTYSRPDHLISPIIRKTLPQTSIKLTPRKVEERRAESLGAEKEAFRYDNEVEYLTIPGYEKIVVSRKLRLLINEISAMYPSCNFMQDLYKTHSNVYKYCYDMNLNRITCLQDLKKAPIELILSERYKIHKNELSLNCLQNSMKNENHSSYQLIDMYGSVITYKKIPSEVHKTPLYVLKKTNSVKRIMKSKQTRSSPVIVLPTIKRIMPGITGKKVKEGAAGFKKPVMLMDAFDKPKKYSKNQGNSLKSLKSLGKSHIKTVNFPNLLKEMMSEEDVRCKYSMTRKEFLEMVQTYVSLKGKNQFIEADALTSLYNVGLSVFKGIDSNFNHRKILTWDEFLEFYSIIVLRRSSFLQNLQFFMNFLNISSISQLVSSENNLDSIISSVFHQKYKQIIRIYKKNAGLELLVSNESAEVLQKEGLSLHDLRLLVDLIITSSN